MISPMDKLLAKLSEQSATINEQQKVLKSSEETTAYSRTVEYLSTSNNTLPITPVTEVHHSSVSSTAPPSAVGDDSSTAGGEEVLRLKIELEAAKARMARMDQELSQSRITKHTIDQAIGTASEADFGVNPELSDPRLAHIQQAMNPGIRPQISREASWVAQDDSRSDTSDALSAGGFNRARNIWGNGGKPGYSQGPVPVFQTSESSNQWMNRGFGGQPFVEAPMAYSGPPFRGDRMAPDTDLLMAPPAGRRNQVAGRFGRGSFPYASSSSSYDGYTPASTPYGSVGGMGGGVGGQLGMGSGMSMGGGSMYGGYQPQPIGTPLSPHAPEFTSSTGGWKNEVSPLINHSLSLC